MILGDTKILTDKGEIPIKDVPRGAAIYHVYHRKAERTTMERVAQSTARTTVTLITDDDRQLTCNLTQQLTAPGAHRPQAHKLRAGDPVYCFDNGVQFVARLSAVILTDDLRENVQVYGPKFENPKQKRYIANGFLCVVGA